MLLIPHALPTPLGLPTNAATTAVVSSNAGPFDYTLTDPADVNAMFQTRVGDEEADFTPSWLWNFNEESGSAIDYGPGSRVLNPNGSTTRVPSLNGKAAHQDLGGDQHWSVNSTFPFNFGVAAFAIAARVRFNAVGGGSFWLSKGSSAAYLAAGLDGDGKISFLVKPVADEIAAVAELASNLADGQWRWVLMGRSLVDACGWINVIGEGASAVLAADKSLSNAGSRFGLWFNLFGTPSGGGDVDVDHLIGWQNDAAENVRAHRSELFWEDVLTET